MAYYNKYKGAGKLITINEADLNLVATLKYFRNDDHLAYLSTLFNRHDLLVIAKMFTGAP